MAIVHVRDAERTIEEPAKIRGFLAPFGIWYHRLETLPVLDESAQDEAILAAFAEPLQELLAGGCYETADVVRIRPDTPGLDEMLAKFDREHTHDDDEVRFIADGRGLFHVHPPGGPVFSIEVEAGDCINVPKGTRHWFHVCQAQRCTAVRLFADPSGWTPHYTGSGIDASHPPVFRGE